MINADVGRETELARGNLMYHVRIPNPEVERPTVEVRGIVDIGHGNITFELPDGSTATVDAVTARALQMLLHAVVFGPLGPIGPHLRVESGAGDD